MSAKPLTRLWPAFRLCALALLSLALLVTASAAQATATGGPVAWGCAFEDSGQCTVPSGLSGVTAIAAGAFSSLALRADGTVVAWGCSGVDNGPCSVPNGLSGVSAIAAGLQSLALKSDGTVDRLGLRQRRRQRAVQRAERPLGRESDRSQPA